MKSLWFYDFEIGRLGIAEDGQGITDIFIADGEGTDSLNNAPFQLLETPLIREAGRQLGAYLSGRIRQFDLPLSLQGTAFQKKVWQALLTIPFGQTRSYKQIAEQVGSPKGYRAIGMANNRNRIMIVVPCHRVIGHDGKLVGYAGGLDVKAKLLQLENRDHS